jgi:hypothetical protein
MVDFDINSILVIILVASLARIVKLCTADVAGWKANDVRKKKLPTHFDPCQPFSFQLESGIYDFIVQGL